ncbi:hypothetical protein C8R45DRAFT_1019665, partial [Mycena sanguinolenta]
LRFRYHHLTCGPFFVGAQTLLAPTFFTRLYNAFPFVLSTALPSLFWTSNIRSAILEPRPSWPFRARRSAPLLVTHLSRVSFYGARNPDAVSTFAARPGPDSVLDFVS